MRNKGFLKGLFVGAAAVIVVLIVMNTASRFARVDQYYNPSNGEFTMEKIEQKLTTLGSLMTTFNVYDSDTDAMVEKMYAAFVAGSGDRYARYYSAADAEALFQGISGNYKGIGVQVIADADRNTYIYRVYKNSPAAEAGIQVGDIIKSVDGTVFLGKDSDDLVARIKGDEDEQIRLGVIRDGQELFFDLTLREVVEDQVAYEMIEDGIGYIGIYGFTTSMNEQFDEAVDSLLSQGMEKVIFDLRGNPGGDLGAVVEAANRLIPDGVIVTLKSTSGDEKTYNADSEQSLDIPMVVLINENTASAAELFTAALADYDMAVTVGKTTYGKGVAQAIVGLKDGSYLKYTSDNYFTPSGSSVDGVGVVPDYEVDYHIDENTFKEAQFEKALEVIRGLD